MTCESDKRSTWKLAVKGCTYRVGKPISLQFLLHEMAYLVN